MITIWTSLGAIHHPTNPTRPAGCFQKDLWEQGEVPLAEGPASIHASVAELIGLGESGSGSSDTQDTVE